MPVIEEDPSITAQEAMTPAAREKLNNARNRLLQESQTDRHTHGHTQQQQATQTRQKQGCSVEAVQSNTSQETWGPVFKSRQDFVDMHLF